MTKSEDYLVTWLRRRGRSTDFGQALPLRRSRRLIAAVALLCAVPAPAGALRPCGPRPAAELVWPGWNTKAKIAADEAVYLRLAVQPSALRAWLAPVGRSTEQIALRLELVPGLGLYAARASKPLAAGAYDLWVRAPRAARLGMPGTVGDARDVKLYPPITVAKHRASARPPTIRKPRARFGAWGERSGDMRRLRRAGRDVYLRFGAKASARSPALIAVEGTYSDGAEKWKVADVLPFDKQVQIGSTGSVRCARRSGFMQPAPKRGRYELKITPWSASGISGPPVEVSGRISTDPRMRGLPP